MEAPSRNGDGGLAHGDFIVTDYAPPIWVRDRDGQVVPFEADRISQSLFAATEHLGHPDAFLRELTDGVVHFLAEETRDLPPSTDELPELVAKVVANSGSRCSPNVLRN